MHRYVVSDEITCLLNLILNDGITPTEITRQTRWDLQSAARVPDRKVRLRLNVPVATNALNEGDRTNGSPLALGIKISLANIE